MLKKTIVFILIKIKNMTNLEIILILSLWIIYGIYFAKAWIKEEDRYDEHDITFSYIASILFSPICLIIRIFRGIFWF